MYVYTYIHVYVYTLSHTQKTQTHTQTQERHTNHNAEGLVARRDADNVAGPEPVLQLYARLGADEPIHIRIHTCE
jgi:hypothetical protein